MKNCIVFYNKKSGKGLFIIKREKITTQLLKNGYNPVFINILKVKEKEIGIILKDENIDLILSAGGDGTFHSVVNHCINNNISIPVSHIPLGSANDISNNFELNELEKVLNGEIKELDIPKINNTNFVYISALGTIPSLSYNTPILLKKQLGYFAYLVNGFNKIKEKGLANYVFRYTVDGKIIEREANEIIISNTCGFGAVKKIFNDVLYDDNLFEVTFINNQNLAQNIDICNDFFVQKKDIKDIKNVTHFQTDNIKIELLNNDDDKWCVDGEEYHRKDEKYNFELNKKMKILLPRQTVQRISR